MFEFYARAAVVAVCLVAGCGGLCGADSGDVFRPGFRAVYESAVRDPNGGRAAVLSEFTVLEADETSRSVLGRVHVSRGTTVTAEVSRPVLFRFSVDGRGEFSQHVGLGSHSFDPANHTCLFMPQRFEAGETTIAMTGAPNWKSQMVLAQTVQEDGDGWRVRHELPADLVVDIHENAKSVIPLFRRDVVVDELGVKSCDWTVVIGPDAESVSTMTAASRRTKTLYLSEGELGALRRDAAVALPLIATSQVRSGFDPGGLQDAYKEYMRDFPAGILSGWAEYSMPLLEEYKKRAEAARGKQREQK